VNQDVLEIHAGDAAELHLKDGETVKVISGRGGITLPCAISERVPPGTLFSTFHFPDTNLNSLLSSSADALSKCPEYKVLTVRLEKVPVESSSAKSAAGTKSEPRRAEIRTRIIV